MKILLFTDEPHTLDLVVSTLVQGGYETSVFKFEENISLILSNVECELLILDLNIQTKIDLEIISEIRSTGILSKIPILVITDDEDENKSSVALNLGADDYLIKPFGVHVLLARIAATLRRCRRLRPSSKIIYKDLTINQSTHEVFIQNKLVSLTLTEHRILTYLVRNFGKLITREELREKSIQNMRISNRTMDVHMSAIRQKLGGLGKELYTIRGFGYRFGKDEGRDATAKAITSNSDLAC